MEKTFSSFHLPYALSTANKVGMEDSFWATHQYLRCLHKYVGWSKINRGVYQTIQPSPRSNSHVKDEQCQRFCRNARSFVLQLALLWVEKWKTYTCRTGHDLHSFWNSLVSQNNVSYSPFPRVFYISAHYIKILLLSNKLWSQPTKSNAFMTLLVESQAHFL